VARDARPATEEREKRLTLRGERPPRHRPDYARSMGLLFVVVLFGYVLYVPGFWPGVFTCRKGAASQLARDANKSREGA